ncbi:hypothetical protein MMC34_007306 [Xylographa carneopallida]|nr:hypothetical protein [Xylographa carneopallida]
MLEPLSITASLLGLGGAAITTATALFRFGETIFRARKQIHALVTELAHFALAPKSLARVLEDHGSLLEPRLLEEVDIHIWECRSILRSIKRDCRVSTSRELTLLDRTKWYFRDDKVRRLQARLERAKASLTLIVGILNLAACLSAREFRGQHERIQEHYENAALFVEVTHKAFETSRELEVGLEDEELEDDELDSKSDLSSHFGSSVNRAISQPRSGARKAIPAALSTKTDSSSASTALSPQLSSDNSPALTTSRLHTSPSRAPAVVRQLLLCWTNVEDVSPYLLLLIAQYILNSRTYHWTNTEEHKVILERSSHPNPFDEFESALGVHIPGLAEAGVGSIIPAACFFLMEGRKEQLLELSRQRLELHPTLQKLAQVVEDARIVYNMASQGNYDLYRMKRFRTGSKDREARQRISRGEWDKEMARTDYHASEFYISIEIADIPETTAHEDYGSRRASKM